MTNPAAAIVKEFPHKRIVVVGDLVADQFLRGTIARVSREAPVFILRHDETETLPGGAANAAVNVAALGGKAVLIGVVGNDANGAALLEKLNELNVDCDAVIANDKFQTTTKVRVLAGQHYAPRQQVIRIDYENQTAIDDELLENLKTNLSIAAENADAIVISDYNYGVANKQTANLAAKLAKDKDIPLLVDSRFNLQNFANAATATPNQEEVEQILGENFTEADCIRLRENLGFEALLVTRGNKGMLLIEKNKLPVRFEAVGAKEPLDVTGAGDTVIAVYALGLASGLSFTDAANLANHAGGIVVMKKGAASVKAEELLASLKRIEILEYKTNSIQ
ncbi:MAG TPA: PfkB family carbohydrate kinase [Pyrinomonadaceae bacterium]|nr:PfkB family carbohydrate kinase [Pyrinomonadaceae bacterium]